jgi:hypothetical protein
MGSSNPVQQLVSNVSNAGNALMDNIVSGVSNTGNSVLDTVWGDYRQTLEDGIDKAGREIGRGAGEITGKNAYERGMRELSDRQEAESNRLLWERDNRIAQNKETDAQAEARKRIRAAQAGGRSGTILTGQNVAPTTQLGASGGKTTLGV